MKKQKVYLCLENGQTFEGYRFGAGGEIQGELVFTTGMGGYIETLTDPSYYGQIVLQTFPLIGNYGFIPEDMESPKSYVSAYIVREYCQAPSNFRCRETLRFLKIPRHYRRLRRRYQRDHKDHSGKRCNERRDL